MIKELRDVVIAAVHQRVAEGDNPITPAQSVETLENIVVELTAELANAPALLALAHQYRSDLLYPPSADSRERRIAAIDAVLAAVGNGENGRG